MVQNRSSLDRLTSRARARARDRDSGSGRMRMRAKLRDLAGPPPPLPPARPRWMRRAAMLRWGWWARLAHLSRRQMAEALGVSDSTVKRLRQAVQRELDWQIGDQQRRAGLLREWFARVEMAERGEEQVPMSPERKRRCSPSSRSWPTKRTEEKRRRHRRPVRA